MDEKWTLGPRNKSRYQSGTWGQSQRSSKAGNAKSSFRTELIIPFYLKSDLILKVKAGSSNLQKLLYWGLKENKKKISFLNLPMTHSIHPDLRRQVTEIQLKLALGNHTEKNLLVHAAGKHRADLAVLNRARSRGWNTVPSGSSVSFHFYLSTHSGGLVKCLPSRSLKKRNLCMYYMYM